MDLIWDYLVFILFIVGSLIASLWNRIRGSKVKTKAQFVFVTGKLPMFAMMLSIARGTLADRAFIGYPSELFYRGSAMWETLYGIVCAYPVVTFLFIPVYFSLGITSVYQYLDLSHTVRCLASGTYIIRSILNLGVTVFTPSIALKTITGMPYCVSLLIITVISIIFNLLGGLKAVIIADVIQGLTMIFVTVIIIVKGSIEAGGQDKLYTRPRDDGRLKFLIFTGDMTVRVDTLSACLGQLFISMSLFGCQQNFAQRYISMSSMKEVTRTMMSNVPLVIVLFSLPWVVGMAVYATYAGCDPLKAGNIKNIDEILPFFVEEKFSYLPGAQGLFVAILFNDSLILNLSNINSVATVTWEDFLSNLPQFKGYTDKQQLNVIKLIACILAVLIMVVGLIVGLLSSVIESATLMASATSGPLLGVFILAMCFPMVNWKGAAIGMIVSHIIAFWITFGSFTIEKSPIAMLPTSIEQCTNDTFSTGIFKPRTSQLRQNTPLKVGWEIHNVFMLTLAMAAPAQERNFLQTLYSISFMYYIFLGTLITVFIGVIVSYLTASSEDVYDSKLLHPLFFKISNWFPGKPRDYTISEDEYETEPSIDSEASSI